MSATSPDSNSEEVTGKAPGTSDSDEHPNPEPKKGASHPQSSGRQRQGPSVRETGRLTIAHMDPETIGEVRGLVLHLAYTGGKDGLQTIGDLLEAALQGKGNLPYWRERYHDNKRFQIVTKDTGSRYSRVTITGVDAELLGELRGFVLRLSEMGGADGLRTIGDVVAAAFQGAGYLPLWRKQFNRGRKFPLVAALPPGKK